MAVQPPLLPVAANVPDMRSPEYGAGELVPHAVLVDEAEADRVAA